MKFWFKEKNLILLGCLFLALNIFLAAHYPITISKAAEIDTHKAMSFSQGDIRDIIYSYSRANDIDIYLFQEVAGRASIQIKESEGVATLENIVLASGYNFIEIEGVYYIGSPENIARLSAEFKFREIDTEKSNILEIVTVNWTKDRTELIRRFFSELEMFYWEDDNILILYGEEEPVAQAKGLIADLVVRGKEDKQEKEEDTLGVEQDKEMKFYLRPGINALLLDKVIKEEVSYEYDFITGRIQLSGPLDKVKVWNEFLAENESIFLSEEVINFDYHSAQQVKDFLQPIYSEVVMQPLADNRLYLKGSYQELQNIQDLTKHLDQIPQQVLVEFEVIEITDFDQREVSLFNSLPSININFSQRGESEISWQEYLTMKKEEDSLKVLAAPSLVSLAGKPARLHIGDRIPLPVYDKEGLLISYEYLDAGIILNLEIEVISNSEIIIDLRPEVSTITHTGATVPQLNTRELETTIRLKCGESYFIGGLFQEYFQQSSSYIPGLYDLPIIGKLFSREQELGRNSEVIISITPHLLDN